MVCRLDPCQCYLDCADLVFAEILTFKPGKGLRVTAPIRMVDDKFTFQQAFICAVTIVTIITWCFSHQLEPYIGEMGVLALIPIVVLFRTGLLSAADFNNFLWTIIALAMGGIALGKAVSSSGLLNTVAHGIEAHVVRGMGLYGVMTVFGIYDSGRGHICVAHSGGIDYSAAGTVDRSSHGGPAPSVAGAGRGIPLFCCHGSSDFGIPQCHCHLYD